MQDKNKKIENNLFRFKEFTIKQSASTMKVNTDGILLGAWVELKNSKNALDIGTGTGLIAMMLAQRNPKLIVDAVEIEESAALEARENTSHAFFNQRIGIHHNAIQDYAATSKLSYDMIVTNPPFFTGGTFSNNENKNNVRHSVKLPHGDLLRCVNTLLTDTGDFSLVLPFVEGLRFIELAGNSRLHLHRKTEVLTRPGKNPERLLLSFSKIQNELKEGVLCIHNKTGNEYSDPMIELTREFYLFL
jgi:tRNA1Val (adenine37-N6)-methyltransferase